MTDDRAQQRAAERDRRATERAALSQERTARRTIEREQASRDREHVREARRLEESYRMKTLRRESSGAERQAGSEPKRRASGSLRRTGEVRVERDTSHYRTVVDTVRIRELARRGASASSLAAVFKMSVEDIGAALGGLSPPTE